MKRILSALLAMVLLMSLFTLPAIAEDTPKLTLFLSGGANPASENSVKSELEKYLGAKLEVIYVTDADYSSKLNTMVAGNQLPDIYKVPSSSLLTELYEGGRLYNFAGLLPEYGPDILAYHGDDLYRSIVNEPGKIHALVKDSGNYLKNLAIRKDWLDKLGLDMPTDPESFYQVLHAFTYGDPDGNGLNDTFGYTGTMVDAASWMHILAAYGIPCSFTNGTCLLEDGTVTTFIKHPRFVEAMEYLRRMYAEGVMDPEFATYTRMQCNELLWQGKVGTYAFQSTGTTNNWYPGRYTFEVPEDPAEMFGFVHLNNTGATAIYPNYTNADLVINADCEYPELAVKLINYIYYTEEGQTLTYLGVEGKHYKWVDKEAGKYEMLDIYTDSAIHRADGAFCYNTSGGFTRENAETRNMNQLTQQAQADEWAVVTEYPYISTVLETRNEYGTALDEIVKECFASLIVSKGDWKAEYEEFVTRWEEEGGSEFEEEATAAYWAENPKE